MEQINIDLTVREFRCFEFSLRKSKAKMIFVWKQMKEEGTNKR